MQVPIEKPGSPEEMLEHFGIKGMKWGVRKQTVSGNTTKTPMSKKKKIVIGVSVATVAVGVGATAYYLHKNGKLPLAKTAKTAGKVYQSLDDIPKVKVSDVVKAGRIADRDQYIKLMMSSKKFAPTLEEATRIANETYPLY